MATESLAKEFAAYERHKMELVSAHEGKCIVIQGDQIAGIWDTYQDALRAGCQQFGLQPFLIKQILRIERVQLFTRNLSFSHADLGATT